MIVGFFEHVDHLSSSLLWELRPSITWERNDRSRFTILNTALKFPLLLEIEREMGQIEANFVKYFGPPPITIGWGDREWTNFFV